MTEIDEYCLYFLVDYTVLFLIVFHFFFATWIILHFIYDIITLKSHITKKIIGKIVVITGGASGLGYELSLILSRLGAIVIIIDIVEEKILDRIKVSFKQSVLKFEAFCHYYHCDVTSVKDLEKVLSEIKKHFGIPTILVNNAAIIDGESIETMSFEKFRRVIDVNFISHFNTVKLFLPGMKEKNEGHIVTIASSLAFIGVTNLSAYCASKTALVSFHESLKYELLYSNSNIRTTLVVPGQLSTSLFQNVKTPSRFLAPVLDPIYVAEKIAKTIINDMGIEIYTPLYCLILPMLRFISLNVTNDPNASSRKLRFLKKRQDPIEPVVKEVTITMTHWVVHHDCLIITTIDASRIKTKSDTSQYHTITGTRDI
ncbi:hypothetical protein MERGE_000031 [Pneumocystis wakefieldiae]|uniref:Uncharacterized protein n=1 Tax=Pneumocystis wakefieldiae TaxID=38082 RepID=A0A899FYV3_9ASCO|nr:hypothetical protein MERGE_000031 [Pneumocystis wakefieldiae]